VPPHVLLDQLIDHTPGDNLIPACCIDGIDPDQRSIARTLTGIFLKLGRDLVKVRKPQRFLPSSPIGACGLFN